MKMYALFLAAVLALSACGKTGGTGPQGPAGAPGAPAPTPTPISSNDADILDVLNNGAHGNAYRESLGQTELSPGLSCQVVKVASGSYLSSSSPGYTAAQAIVTTGTTYTYLYNGPFDQPSQAGTLVNNLLPTALQGMFQNVNFRIVCSGYIVVQNPGWYAFQDQSDDGSVIFTDAGQLYNDGNHALNTTPVVSSMNFTRDVHSIQIWYAQSGSGLEGLILNVNGSPIPSNLMFH